MRPEGRPNLASSSRRAPVRPRAGPVPGGPERRQHPGAAPARQRAPRNPEAGHVPPGAWLSDRAGRSPGLRAARPRQIPWGTPPVPRGTPGHCAPEPTVPKRPCATLTSGCSRTASFPGALTPKGQGDADGGRSPAVRPQRAACARGLKREARIGCTCSARPGALGAGRAHVAPHLAANGSAPALPPPVTPGGPARGLGGLRGGPAGGEGRAERSGAGVEGRRPSGFFSQAAGRLWNLRGGFQCFPSGLRRQYVTVMSVRRGGSLATRSPGLADGNGAQATAAGGCAGLGGGSRTARRGTAARNHEKVHVPVRIKKGTECTLNFSIKRLNLKR